MPDDGNLVVVEGLHLSPVQVHVPVHDDRNEGAAEAETSVIELELSPLDPFVVVDFVLGKKPVLPSSSAARSSAVLGRNRVVQYSKAAARTKARARREAGSSSSLHISN